MSWVEVVEEETIKARMNHFRRKKMFFLRKHRKKCQSVVGFQCHCLQRQPEPAKNAIIPTFEQENFETGVAGALSCLLVDCEIFSFH